jgi:hypothetical protein
MNLFEIYDREAEGKLNYNKEDDIAHHHQINTLHRYARRKRKRKINKSISGAELFKG